MPIGSPPGADVFERGNGSTGLSLKTPNCAARKALFAAGFVAAFLAYALPAWAQDDDMSLLRDTETEEMLRGYETPLARAARGSSATAMPLRLGSLTTLEV